MDITKNFQRHHQRRKNIYQAAFDSFRGFLIFARIIDAFYQWRELTIKLTPSLNVPRRICLYADD